MRFFYSLIYALLPLLRPSISYDPLDLQSKFQTPAPSTVAELYSVVATLIKDSKKQVVDFCKAEFANIRKEMTAEFANIRKQMKVGEKPAEKSTFEKSGASKETFMDIDGSKENHDIDFHMVILIYFVVFHMFSPS